ncbi:reverse transcriptase domain-containing protein [Tanacetum coccineum]
MSYLGRFVIVICVKALLEAFGRLSISVSFSTVSIVMIRRMLGKVAKESLGIACGVVAGCDNDVEEDDDMDDEEEEHPVLADSVPPPVHRTTCYTYSPPLPVSSLLPVSSPLPVSPPLPASPTHLLGYRAAMIWLRAEAPYTSHPPPLVDALEVCLPPPKRLCITFGPRADYGFIATMDREIRRDLERDVGYGITNTWDEMLEDMLGAPATDETEAVLSGRLNLLQRDRRSHAYTALLMEREARLSLEIAALRAQTAPDRAQLAESLRLRVNCSTGGLTALQRHHNSGIRVLVRMKDILVNTVGHDSAYGMPWKILMKMMTNKYCPRNESKKLEMEIWDLKVKGADLTSYTQRFQELALLYGRMFPEESDKIERYVGGLLDMIHGSVVASKPKTM